MDDDYDCAAAGCDDDDVKRLIAEIFADDAALAAICWLRYQGYTRDEITEQGYTPRQFIKVSERLRQKFGDDWGRRKKRAIGTNHADGNHA